MELYKRERSPYWWVHLIHPITGERIRESTKQKTKVAAQQVARKLLDDLEAGGGKSEVTLQDALEAYCTALESAGKASAGEARSLARKALGGLGKDRFSLPPSLPLTRVVPTMMEALLQARRKEGLAAQTIAHEIKLIRAAMRHAAGLGQAVNRDMIDGSIPNAWRMPALPMKTRYLSVEEFRLVHDHLDPARPITQVGRSGTAVTYTLPPHSRAYRERQDAQDLFLALAMCGGRWSEVKSLRWDRIDLQQRTIRLWGNKTQRERLLGMPEMLYAMLWRRWQIRKSGQPLIFPTLSGSERASSSKSALRAMKACGLNSTERVQESGKATIHSLRHTFASLLLQHGATLADIQDALGHTSMAMTRRYSHLEKGAAARKLAGIMDSVTTSAASRTVSTADVS